MTEINPLNNNTNKITNNAKNSGNKDSVIKESLFTRLDKDKNGKFLMTNWLLPDTKIMT